MLAPNHNFPDTVHRVSVREDTATVDVLTLGMGRVDGLSDGVYTMDQLPTHIKEKLAVLSIIEIVDPEYDPTSPNESIKGVGKRISESVYWIYED
jgi:hypothetical protein